MAKQQEQKNNHNSKEAKEVLTSLAERVLIEPLVTEATASAVEANKYVFKVGSEANKQQIKLAVEMLYKVKVIGVNTLNLPRKQRRTRNSIGWKPGFKKAVVTLKDSDKITLYE